MKIVLGSRLGVGALNPHQTEPEPSKDVETLREAPEGGPGIAAARSSKATSGGAGEVLPSP